MTRKRRAIGKRERTDAADLFLAGACDWVVSKVAESTIQVETGRANAPALAGYRRAGFVQVDHVHLTLGLADPTHAS